MSAQLYITIDRRLFEEGLLRVLSELEPDPHTQSGKRDMRVKAEVDGLLSYLQAAKPLVENSLYPTPRPRG